MIQMGTILDVADNTGAKKIACITVLGGSTGDYGHLGDVISASVKEAAPDGTVKKGAKVQGGDRAHRAGAPPRRRQLHRFDNNAAVIINDAKEPVGTRVFGPVARELRERRFMKIISLAPEVI